MIFLRFHDISNDVRQRGRRSKYAFDYERLQKGHRASQMLQLNKVVLPEETKLKAIGQRMHKVLKAQKLAFGPTKKGDEVE